MSPKKIAWGLIVLASLFISGCRITFAPIVSLASLNDKNVRTAPVIITANTASCDMDFLKEAANYIKMNFIIKPVECKPSQKGFNAVWEAEIPLLRTGDETKIPHVPASIYYSRNHSVILTLKRDFLNNVVDRYRERGGMVTDADTFVAVLFKNDTQVDVNIAVENVFINGAPVGRDMAIYKIKKGGSVLVRLSDIGFNSLLLGGIEAAAVFPAAVEDGSE